ncbi:MAG: hypothetical protein M3Y22_04490 [Pseudomonadota bacterium]|nr:hypothetical protein [Pseudomonadota bacterium]
MTQISSEIETASGTGRLHHPSDILLALIVAFLVPMFVGVSDGDVRLARMAAIETVNAYRARNHADLIAVAQIVAFGLAALGSLSLSMADELTLSMTLRLRGNAIACNRSAERNRRARTSDRAENSQPDIPLPQDAGMAAEPEIPTTFAAPRDDNDNDNGGDNDLAGSDTLLSPAAAQELAAEAEARLRDPGHQAARDAIHAPTSIAIPLPPPGTSEKRHQAMWAIAMVKECGEISAGMANLPPVERQAASVRAAALSGTAHNLLYGMPDAARQPPPDALDANGRPNLAGE